ncbi:MAG: ECF transporter S component [Clostridia bacterium]|nr:ECF transporter S component [Clostridia bacterium]
MFTKKSHQSLLDITFISLFAALCYIALTVFFFPVGPMFVHFGNLIVVLAALLIGGWQGGLAGSIGMGLYDILNGHADSSPKTFILKFLIGLTVGLVFVALNRISKRKTLNATVGAVCGMIVNLTGEILWKTVQYSLAGSSINAAFVTSLLSQSSTLLNAVIAVIGGVALFKLLEKPVEKIKRL